MKLEIADNLAALVSQSQLWRQVQQHQGAQARASERETEGAAADTTMLFQDGDVDSSQ